MNVKTLFKPGKKVKISGGSGLDSDKIGIVVSESEHTPYKSNWVSIKIEENKPGWQYTSFPVNRLTIIG